MEANNKRIAKNTLMLYFRMILLMGVSLYTSRIVLNTLGVDDYGVYNVVGGFIAMFSILSNSLSKAISRYLTFELAKGDKVRLKQIFSTSVNIQIIMAIAIILLGEVGGLWFISNKMNIDPNRIMSANWVLQFSLLNFAINLISVPYNAAVVAHEKMSVFAYISLLEAFLKLVAIFMLGYLGLDKLIGWAFFQTSVSFIIRFVYAHYCNIHFDETQYQFILNKSLLKEMFSFASWNFIGSIGGVLRAQGVNMLLNVFFGTAINAARGLAVQVSNAINGFVSNFVIAVNPQITKLYAQDKIQESYNLCMISSRLSFFLLLTLSLPIAIEIDYILGVWLTTIPNCTSLFIKQTLLLALVESISLPLITIQLATGNIKNYQLVVGGIHLLNFPISWILLKKGFGPDCVYWVAIILSEICLLFRLIMLKSMIQISIMEYVKNVLIKTTVVFVIALLIAYYIKLLIDSPIVCMFLIGFACSVIICICGLKTNEIKFIFKLIRRK